MEGLIYFIVWAVVLFLVMRLGCGAHVMGHGSGQRGQDGSRDQARWIPPNSDFDPVCDRVVRPEDALSSVYDGRVYYFCGVRCREKFEADPHGYLARSGTPPTAAIQAQNV